MTLVSGGLPWPAKVKRLHGVATADDLVHRKFHRLAPNELWVTDFTEHPTREGKVYCCAVMDTFSRKIVGWSIDDAQDSALVVNALDMAVKNRQPPAGGIVHADHGVQFTSWAFTNKIRSSGLMPSFGTIGDCQDNSRTPYLSTLRFFTTANGATHASIICPQSSTSYDSIKHPFPPDLQASAGNQNVGHANCPVGHCVGLSSSCWLGPGHLVRSCASPTSITKPLLPLRFFLEWSATPRERCQTQIC